MVKKRCREEEALPTQKGMDGWYIGGLVRHTGLV